MAARKALARAFFKGETRVYRRHIGAQMKGMRMDDYASPKDRKANGSNEIRSRIFMPPLALRPHDAADALGISKSSLDKYVKQGKIRPPVALPGLNVRLFDAERLRQDWQALLEEAENGSTNPCDELLNP